jgi:hypothetical protein
VVRRWSEGGQKVVRRWSEGGQKVDRRWSEGGQKVVRRWSEGGQKVGRRWSEGGQKVVRRWSEGGQKVGTHLRALAPPAVPRALLRHHRSPPKHRARAVDPVPRVIAPGRPAGGGGRLFVGE